MFIRRSIGLVLAGALFCATGSLGSVCELYCNTAPQSHSHFDMPNHDHDAHHNMANCRDCTNHGVQFFMNDSSCHHLDQARLLEKSPYCLTLSSLNWQAAGLYALSALQSRGSRGTPGSSNPLALRQTNIPTPLVLSLRI